MGNSSSGVSKEWFENRLKNLKSIPEYEPLPLGDDACPKGGVLMKLGTSRMKLCHGIDGKDGADAPKSIVTTNYPSGTNGAPMEVWK